MREGKKIGQKTLLETDGKLAKKEQGIYSAVQSRILIRLPFRRKTGSGKNKLPVFYI